MAATFPRMACCMRSQRTREFNSGLLYVFMISSALLPVPHVRNSGPRWNCCHSNNLLTPCKYIQPLSAAPSLAPPPPTLNIGDFLNCNFYHQMKSPENNLKPPSCMPPCLPACLLVYLHASLSKCMPPCLPACLLVYPHASLSTCMPPCLHACLSV